MELGLLNLRKSCESKNGKKAQENSGQGIVVYKEGCAAKLHKHERWRPTAVLFLFPMHPPSSRKPC